MSWHAPWARNQQPFVLKPETILDVARPVVAEVAPAAVEKVYPDEAARYQTDPQKFHEQAKRQRLGFGLGIDVILILTGIIINIVEGAFSDLIASSMQRKLEVLVGRRSPDTLPKFTEAEILQAVHRAAEKIPFSDDDAHYRQEIETVVVRELLSHYGPDGTLS
jgi:hypothetical protein